MTSEFLSGLDQGLSKTPFQRALLRAHMDLAASFLSSTCPTITLCSGDNSVHVGDVDVTGFTPPSHNHFLTAENQDIGFKSSISSDAALLDDHSSFPSRSGCVYDTHQSCCSSRPATPRHSQQFRVPDTGSFIETPTNIPSTSSATLFYDKSQPVEIPSEVISHPLAGHFNRSLSPQTAGAQLFVQPEQMRTVEQSATGLGSTKINVRTYDPADVAEMLDISISHKDYQLLTDPSLVDYVTDDVTEAMLMQEYTSSRSRLPIPHQQPRSLQASRAMSEQPSQLNLAADNEIATNCTPNETSRCPECRNSYHDHRRCLAAQRSCLKTSANQPTGSNQFSRIPTLFN
ncbi:unnamed protein product [Protopolystoma xenopodis]|uniref:Uncharacterized protein n=1 Tax=Protopolystoma xenopodis TaxID=117903 RepID=A0A448WSK8_9PLAT|nr:unnamed protein product [Protopolystoma xenopodis]